MVKKQEGRYRKARSATAISTIGRDNTEYGRSTVGPWTSVTSAETKLADERKAYASKVKSLIEKKNRSLNKVRKTEILRDVLATYPKNVRLLEEPYYGDGGGGERCLCREELNEWDGYDPDLEDVYESQKLNFRRMISNMSKQAYEVDSDFDSWSDLESNFSLIYESSPGHQLQRVPFYDTYVGDDDDDVDLTLEKVKNMKNVVGSRKRPRTTPNGGNVGGSWDRCSSVCDSWSFCACSTSDVSSFLSTCTCCQTMRRISEVNTTNNNNKNNLVNGGCGGQSCGRSFKDNRYDGWSLSEYSQTYEPVSAERMVWSSRIKLLKQKLRASTLSKASTGSWDSWRVYSNFSSIPLAISSKEKRMKELMSKLKEDLNNDWDSQGNVSLGLIYVPMQGTDSKQGLSTSVKKPPPVPPRKPANLLQQMLTTPSLVSPKRAQDDEVDSEKTDEIDPLGSLESLIFEPKESMFPDAIGRNNKLKASISVSNISNPSLSESSDSTLKSPDSDVPTKNKGETSRSTSGVTGSSVDSVSNGSHHVGSYWDWGKVKASKIALNTSENIQTHHSPTKMSWLSTDPKREAHEGDSDYTYASEQPSGTTASECKTCAGTSVASWTYIGLQVGGNKLASPSRILDGVEEGSEEDESQCIDVGGDTVVDVEVHSPPLPPSQPKKAVTWKMISDKKCTDGTSKTTITVPSPTSTSKFVSCPMYVTEVYNSWSDLESLIFASEDCGSCSSTIVPSLKDIVAQPSTECTSGGGGPSGHVNRMSCYRDDWLYWDQQRKQRKMPVPRWEQTWRNKAKRMLLWMHYSQGIQEGEEGGGRESGFSAPVEQWSWWKAKQRASILWLICKANCNKVPDDLKDPYYKDHEDQDQLKPLVVHALASAEYYCLALGNIYADPNYHNLNHWGVIQALARKGVYVAEPSDVSLTETVLIQTSPIRMSAHMAVIEAIMALYLKETITVERIVHAVKRFVPAGGPIELPTDIEEALVFWINKVCVKMKHRIEDEMNIATPEVQKAKGAVMSKGVDVSRQAVRSKSANGKLQSVRRKSDDGILEEDNDGHKSYNVNERVAPPIPLLQDLGDLSDGCSIASVISYYCPSALTWQDICLNEPMSMADSLYNIQLVQKFCRDHLPFDPCFLTLEDLVYQHSSIRQNILVFLAELFYVFEVRPSRCVKGSSSSASRTEAPSPEAAGLVVKRNGHGRLVSGATKRSFQQSVAVSPIPDLRTNSCSYNSTVDMNRISPKSATSVHREPLLPRRQSSQHERMQDRSKRYSYTDGPKGGCVTATTTNSMRRTHSMQDIDKNGSNVDTRVDPFESGYYTAAPQSISLYPQRSLSEKENREENVYDDTSELYLKPLTIIGNNEPLMPAIVKPAKEKSNRDSKPDELGESSNKSRGFVPVKRNSPPLVVESGGKSSFSKQLLDSSNFPSELADYHQHLTNNQKNEKYSDFEFPDNREIEEHLRSERSVKQPFILTSDDCARIKEGLESLGSSESGVFMDRDLHLRKELYPTTTTSFAQLSKLRDHQGGGINIVYMQHDRDSGSDGSRHPLKSSFLQRGRSEKGDRKASFATLPNQTTWQQQGRQNSHPTDSGHDTASEANAQDCNPLATQLCDIRLKLEDKRRRIESDKKKMEMMMGRMRQKVGKAAFLQAVSKGKASGNGLVEEAEDSVAASRHHQAQTDVAGDTNGTFVAVKGRLTPSPDVDSLTYDEYGQSIEQLNTSLCDLQTDIQRLTLKQEEIQSMMRNGVDNEQQHQQSEPQSGQQFYLHENNGQSFPSLQRSASREIIYHNLQRSQSREQLYQQQPLQRSQSREQLFQQPLQRSLSREQLYQQQPLQRTLSREQLYQQQPLQRTLSREQLYHPLQRSQSREQLYQQQPMQRTYSREQLYQPIQQSQSREQLYQAPLQRSPSHEFLYQPQQQPLAQWAPQIQMEPPSRPVSVGPILTQQHAYVDQSGYILHAQPPTSSGYQLGPQYFPVNMANRGMSIYHNGPSVVTDQYVHFGQYPQQQQQPMLGGNDGYGGMDNIQAPFRLHVDVPVNMSPQVIQQHQAPSSRSQSPMSYHMQQQQPPISQPLARPSRPNSASSFPMSVHQVSLPAKATPITAPPESVMEPQSVHFIEGSESCDDIDGEQFMDRKPPSSLEHIVSGTATYRVREPTSPTRPVLGQTFRVPKPKVLSPVSRDFQLGSPSQETTNVTFVSDDSQSSKSAGDNDKGFFVSFDDDQPKRPKPPLRAKKVPKVVSKSEAGTPEREMAPEIYDKAVQQLQTGSNVPRISPQRSRASLSFTDRKSVEYKTPPRHFEEPDSGSAESDVSGPREDTELMVTPRSKANASAVGLVIDGEFATPTSISEDEMARRKEKILMSVIKRKEEQEILRAKKEMEAAKRREHERMKQEMQERKKDDERARRQAILEQYRQRKAAMEEQEGGDRNENLRTTTLPKNKIKTTKPRPKSLHESALSAAENRAAHRLGATGGGAGAGAGSQLNLAGNGACGYSGVGGATYRYSDGGGAGESVRGRSTPPRGLPSPGKHPSSPTSYVSPPGLPPGLVSRRIGGLFSDTASDSCSTTSSTVEYTGPKLFKQPTAKSNRGIIVNAINAVLAGAVNDDTKKRVLQEIARSDSKHFLILFRDAGCQFRSLYSYSPEKEEVFRLMGTGPKQVTEKMMDKFFKYNCGGRNFTEIQTKHLTVTIDAFTIHNSLWQGKRVLPPKKEFF